MIYSISPYQHIKSHEKAYRCTASLTAECALILPLFLTAVLALLLVLDLYGSCVQENLRLSNRTRQAAVLSLLAPDAAPSWIDMRKSCTLGSGTGFLSVKKVSMTARARVRAYTGFAPSDFSHGSLEGEIQKVVYVTDYESVYHTHADCSHLDITVIAANTSSVGRMRNEYGERYRPCDGFPKGYKGTVYVTAHGDRYYPSTDYAALTRHVHMETADDVSGLHICSRCAARDHAS